MSWAKLIGRISGVAKKYGETHREVRLDSSTHALMRISYQHHEIHDGNNYNIFGTQSLAINNVYDVQWTTPDTAVEPHFTWEFITDDTTDLFIYEGASIVLAGTAITPINNNRNSSNTSGQTIKGISNASVALANADTAVAGATTIYSQRLFGSNFSAHHQIHGEEIILKRNTIYCMRAVAIAAANISFLCSWYEHTAKD